MNKDQNKTKLAEERLDEHIKELRKIYEPVTKKREYISMTSLVNIAEYFYLQGALDLSKIHDEIEDVEEENAENIVEKQDIQ